MTDRELMQQALEMIGKLKSDNWLDRERQGQVWDALRDRLAQPEQGPMACRYCHYSHTLGAVYFDQNCVGCVKRMTSPPQRPWVGLTDEEIQEIMEKTVASCTELDDITGDTARFTWRKIEAKLKEKNT